MTWLSDVEIRLLREISEGDHPCSETYRPAQALVAAGLATFKEPGLLYATEAGVKELETYK